MHIHRCMYTHMYTQTLYTYTLIYTTYHHMYTYPHTQHIHMDTQTYTYTYNTHSNTHMHTLIAHPKHTHLTHKSQREREREREARREWVQVMEELDNKEAPTEVDGEGGGVVVRGLLSSRGESFTGHGGCRSLRA